MLEIFLTSSVLIAALALMRRLLRGRIHPRLQYALWLLVAVRLLLPVSLVKSPVSVMNAMQERVIVTQRLTAPENRRAPQTGGGESQVQAQPDAEAAAEKAAEPQLPDTAVLRSVWLSGMALAAILVLAQNLRLRQRLRRVRAEICCPQSPIPVWLAPGLPSPCLVGVVRPAIYLTPEAMQDEKTMQLVLRHELAHLRAGDQLWSLVRLVCLCIYWFHPFVWLAAALSQRDCELACDARVMAEMDDVQRAEYGRALLGLIRTGSAHGQLLSGATTMQLGKQSLKERITLIAKRPKMAVYTLVTVLIFNGLLAACTFTGAPAPTAPEPTLQSAQSEQEQLRQALLEEEETLNEEAPQPVEDDPEAEFQMAFPMLDYASFQSYLDEHPETLDSGWEHICINEAGLDDEGTSILTLQGDPVLAIDAEYGILLVRAAGEGYRGVLAICRYPELLHLRMSAQYGEGGQSMEEIAAENHGILAMNASSFLTHPGDNDGRVLLDYAMADGQEYGRIFEGVELGYTRAELDQYGNLRLCSSSQPLGDGCVQAAVGEVCILTDGQKQPEIDNWFGQNLRACLGQRADGALVLLAVEGRRPDAGIYGISVDGCAEILLRYECRNALLMGYGSPVNLWYDGEYLLQSGSAIGPDERLLPDAWVYG